MAPRRLEPIPLLCRLVLVLALALTASARATEPPAPVRGSTAPAPAPPAEASSPPEAATEPSAPEGAHPRPASAPQSSTPTTTPRASDAPNASPFAESIEKATERSSQESQDPCALAEKRGVPCFPSNAEKDDDEVSVAESLKKWKEDASGYEGGNTTIRSPAGTPLSGFDPVHAVEGLVRILSGKNTTFFLYRVWDRSGERAVLRDDETPPVLDPTDRKAGYALVRKVRGQPAAIKAFDVLNRQLRDHNRTRTGIEVAPPR